MNHKNQISTSIQTRYIIEQSTHQHHPSAPKPPSPCTSPERNARPRQQPRAMTPTIPSRSLLSQGTGRCRCAALSAPSIRRANRRPWRLFKTKRRVSSDASLHGRRTGARVSRPQAPRNRLHTLQPAPTSFVRSKTPCHLRQRAWPGRRSQWHVAFTNWG